MLVHIRIQWRYLHTDQKYCVGHPPNQPHYITQWSMHWVTKTIVISKKEIRRKKRNACPTIQYHKTMEVSADRSEILYFDPTNYMHTYWKCI